MDNRPIGVFDSGVGGMTVLKELIKKLPNENYIYLGDTKCFPYGSKSKQTIIDLSRKGIEFLISKNVKLIVIACGTATSQALNIVKNEYNLPIIGVIEPTTNYIKSTGKTQIGVMATAGTIRSKGWGNSILEKKPNAQVHSIACPLLASMVEEGWYDNEIAKLAVAEYLKDLPKVDALILGCTHYPLLTNVIQKQVGKKVEIINIGTYVAKETEEILKNENMLAEEKSGNNEQVVNNVQTYLTETENKFNVVAGSLLGKTVNAELVKEEITIN